MIFFKSSQHRKESVDEILSSQSESNEAPLLDSLFQLRRRPALAAGPYDSSNDHGHDSCH